jgi:hypothetical protein
VFGLYPFTFDLICGDVVIPLNTSNLSCGGPTSNWISTETLYQYDPNDDSEITLSFIDNVEGACGGPAQTVVLKLVKQ